MDIKGLIGSVEDVYNMQLSNEPAEELAKILVDSGGKDITGQNNFELCGFVSGGSEAMEGVIKLARQVNHHDSYHRIIMSANLVFLFLVLPRNRPTETQELHRASFILSREHSCDP
jgi:hypothetical protein